MSMSRGIDNEQKMMGLGRGGRFSNKNSRGSASEKDPDFLILNQAASLLQPQPVHPGLKTSIAYIAGLISNIYGIKRIPYMIANLVEREICCVEKVRRVVVVVVARGAASQCASVRHTRQIFRDLFHEEKEVQGASRRLP